MLPALQALYVIQLDIDAVRIATVVISAKVVHRIYCDYTSPLHCIVPLHQSIALHRSQIARTDRLFDSYQNIMLRGTPKNDMMPATQQLCVHAGCQPDYFDQVSGTVVI